MHRTVTCMTIHNLLVFKPSTEKISICSQYIYIINIKIQSLKKRNNIILYTAHKIYILIKIIILTKQKYYLLFNFTQFLFGSRCFLISITKNPFRKVIQQNREETNLNTNFVHMLFAFRSISHLGKNRQIYGIITEYEQYYM